MDEKNGIEIPQNNDALEEAAGDEPFSEDSQQVEADQGEKEVPMTADESSEEVSEEQLPEDESPEQSDIPPVEDQLEEENAPDLVSEEDVPRGFDSIDDNRQTLVSSDVPGEPAIKQADFQQLSASSVGQGPRNIELLMDVELPVSIELGQTKMSIHDILALVPGSIVELDKLVGEPVDLLVNRKRVARGEVVVVEENFGLRITQLVSPEERLKNL